MRLYGLIGYPLSASFSQAYFKEKFVGLGLMDVTYDNYPLTHIEDLISLLAVKPLLGFNVTSPYKRAILDYLDLLDPKAKLLGAVNTVKRLADGRLKGYNTDIDGFMDSWQRWQAPSKGSVLIFGSGGAARAAALALSELGCMPALVSRNPAAINECLPWPILNYSEVWNSSWAHDQIWVQASPLGMAYQPHTCLDLPFEKLKKGAWAYDMIYNPEKTLFLERCEERGATVKNGLDMLKAQAEAAWRIWQS